MEEAAPQANTRIRRLPPHRVDCKWWKKGYCYRGRDCYFRHDEKLCGVDKLTVLSSAAQEEITAKVGENNDSSTSLTASPGASRRLSDSPATDATGNTAEPDKCGICLELPATYGLLLHCDHVFCLACIRNWRSSNNDGTGSPYSDTSNDSNPTKTCPMCRTQSDFIVPSSIFPTPQPRTATTGGEGSGTHPKQAVSKVSIPTNLAKQKIVNDYLAKRQKIPCRYFQEGVNRWREAVSRKPIAKVSFRPICFFGNKCHYAHTCPITGEDFEFSPQQIRDMERIRSRRRSNAGFDLEVDIPQFTSWERLDVGNLDESMRTPQFFEFIPPEVIRSALASFAPSDASDRGDRWDDCDSNHDRGDDLSDSDSDPDAVLFPGLPDLIPADCFEYSFYTPLFDHF